MTILDPSMSLQWIKKLGVLGIVDMRQLLLNDNPTKTDHNKHGKKIRFRRFRIRENMWWKLFIGQNEREEIDNETRSKIALSTIAVALNNTNCSVPCFVQVMDRYKDIFNGFSVGGGLRTNYEMIVLKVS